MRRSSLIKHALAQECRRRRVRKAEVLGHCPGELAHQAITADETDAHGDPVVPQDREPFPVAPGDAAAGKKRGKDVGKMKPAQSQEEVSDLYRGEMKTLWFPVDFAFEKKKEGEDVEVQLVEKKNKLFGKLESDWKG